LREIVYALNKTNLDVVYTAHVREPTDLDRKKKKFAIRPSGPEKCFEVLAQEVNLIGWLYKEDRGNERLISFEGTNLQTGKSQISTIEERTYKVAEIPELIRKWKNQ
jgi:hypothetical protein